MLPHGVRTALVAWVLAFLAPFAVADSDLSRKLAADDVAGAALLVKDADAIQSVRDDATEIRIAATVAADRAATAAANKDFAAVTEFLVQAAEAAAAAKSGDSDAWWAVAEARSAGLIAKGAAGQKLAIDLWLGVADVYEKAQALRPGTTDARKRCVRRLVEAVATLPSQQPILVARAIASARAGVLGEAPPKGDLTAPPKLSDAEITARDARSVAFADALFGGARVLVTTDRRSTRDVLRAAFDILRPTWAGPDTEKEAGTLWNDMVTFERECKFGIGEKYAARRETVLHGNYDAEIPIGGKWMLDSSGATHVARDGTTIGTISWESFEFDVGYGRPNGVSFLGGDNPSGLADLFFLETAARVFESAKVLREPRKTKITAILFAFCSELAGTTHEKKYGRVRSYFFRGVNMRSYLIQLSDATPAGSELDVETAAFFESFRERKQK